MSEQAIKKLEAERAELARTFKSGGVLGWEGQEPTLAILAQQLVDQRDAAWRSQEVCASHNCETLRDLLSMRAQLKAHADRLTALTQFTPSDPWKYDVDARNMEQPFPMTVHEDGRITFELSDKDFDHACRCVNAAAVGFSNVIADLTRKLLDGE